MFLRPPDAYSRKLAELREKLLGIIDTQLPCVCGKGNVMDHASDTNPNPPPRSIQDSRFGPGPDHRERLEAFHVYHEYYCNKCGLSYRNDIVEKERAYLPLEKTPEGIALGKIDFRLELKLKQE